MTLADVAIILCRPSEPGNVGAVCRTMKNMGLSRLRLVSPDSLDEGIIRARAVHAGDIWERAETFASLAAAIADCTLVIGTTRRRGRRRKGVTLTPCELAVWLQDRNGRAALVFGNERTGLDTEELALCGAASHIPASSAFPSLNLSHAVQIYAYELFLSLGAAEEKPPLGTWVPLPRRDIECLTASVTDSLAALGFYKQPGREDQERFFRDIFSRAGLTAWESEYINALFAKAARLTAKQVTSSR